MNTPELVGALRGRGLALSVVNDALVVRPATGLTADDRETIRRRLPELIAALTIKENPSGRAEPGAAPNAWDREARRLMHNADALVSELGVDGRNPAVAGAAAMVVSAHATHDLETLRFAVAEFVAVVRGLAAVRSRPK